MAENRMHMYSTSEWWHWLLPNYLLNQCNPTAMVKFMSRAAHALGWSGCSKLKFRNALYINLKASLWHLQQKCYQHLNEAINTTKVVLHNVKVPCCAPDLVNTALVSKQKFMVIASGSRPEEKTQSGRPDCASPFTFMRTTGSQSQHRWVTPH